MKYLRCENFSHCAQTAAILVLWCSCVSAQNNQNNFQGLPPATTVQQPTFGVAINAQGVLAAKVFAGPMQRAQLLRNLQANPQLPQDIRRVSGSRKVSLRRLADYVALQLDQQQALSEEALKLAGLTGIHSVVILPAAQDVVIAGTAEGWYEDASGRHLGLTTGAPTILLEDLVTALQQFHPVQPRGNWVGCSIEPRAQALADLKQFNRTIPKSVSQSAKQQVVSNVVRGTAQTLGNADIKVFGISPKTHMAKVLIEADYRMKLIAVGLEPPPIRMASFFALVKTPPRSAFQRWWFVPSKDCVKMAPDRLAIQLVGDQVELLTEDYATTKTGQLFHTGNKPSGAATRFAKQFTDDYGKIAQASPVFAQMKNMIDLLIAAAFLQQTDAFSMTDLASCAFFAHGDSLVQSGPEPKEVPCVANGAWKGNQMIAIAGGGVSIDALAMLRDAEKAAQQGDLKIDGQIQLPGQPDKWWWD